ncbi:MAG: hypothetical protein KDD82_29570, partial [Planctomycetes bacterium]|nr:hypothetical protein [Planctomycetota bacterium]
LMCVAVILGSYLMQFAGLRMQRAELFVRLPLAARGLCYAGLAFLVLTFNKGAQPFIYFQF